MAEILVIKVLGNSRAGITDSRKVTFIDKDAGVQRPLATAPWTTGMGHTAIPIEDTVSIDHLHLSDSIGHPQVFLSSLGQRQAQEVDKAFNILLIKRNRRLTMTAVTTSFAFEYVFQIAAPLTD